MFCCTKNTYNFTLCMLCFPNCKINLGLFVTHRRSDGYHDLETVFYPVGKKDALEIVPAPQTQLHMSGLAVAGDATDNLVLKAWQLLAAQYPGRVPTMDIYLNKTIPMGAGLGGGSSDGAFMLRLINDFCGLGIDQATLAELALQLGSDCPFFIYNTPQFATGRGEVMTPVAVDLSSYTLQVICPEVHVSTRDAFGTITPRPAPFNLRDIATLPVTDWKYHLSNDFELPVFSRHPVLAGIKAQLYEQGAIYASMSGSGSAIYGLFPQGQKASVRTNMNFTEFVS